MPARWELKRLPCCVRADLAAPLLARFGCMVVEHLHCRVELQPALLHAPAQQHDASGRPQQQQQQQQERDGVGGADAAGVGLQGWASAHAVYADGVLYVHKAAASSMHYHSIATELSR